MPVPKPAPLIHFFMTSSFQTLSWRNTTVFPKKIEAAANGRALSFEPGSNTGIVPFRPPQLFSAGTHIAAIEIVVERDKNQRDIPAIEIGLYQSKKESRNGNK
jgi:hypothetical protein